MRRLFMMLSGVCLLSQAYAFPCYITMVKDSCWSSYNVSVDVIDVATEKVLATMSMPNGKSWDRKEIVCQPKQTVNLQATFSPAFWTKDAGKKYYGKRLWSFPEEIKKGDSAWNMTICYSSDLQGVPFPPDASGQCTCVTKDIPAIEPR